MIHTLRDVGGEPFLHFIRTTVEGFRQSTQRSRVGVVEGGQAIQGIHASAATPLTRSPLSVLECYESGLAAQRLWARDASGERFAVPVADWTAASIAGDASLVARCCGPVLDVGCGPGRIVSALSRRGVDALGIDLSAKAVARARKMGANALRCCVFGSVPRTGMWSCAVLADGNIGIGGDPERLLSTVRRLVRADGRVLTEVAGPHVGTAVRELRLEDDGGSFSDTFHWADVSITDIEGVAGSSGFDVTDWWTSAGRWFVTLGRHERGTNR